MDGSEGTFLAPHEGREHVRLRGACAKGRGWGGLPLADEREEEGIVGIAN